MNIVQDTDGNQEFVRCTSTVNAASSTVNDVMYTGKEIETSKVAKTSNGEGTKCQLQRIGSNINTSTAMSAKTIRENSLPSSNMSVYQVLNGKKLLIQPHSPISIEK